jgi:transcriptional regulator
MRQFKDATKDRYLEIYKLRQDGWTYQAIGEKYGFTRARAFAICRLAKNYLLPSEPAEAQ